MPVILCALSSLLLNPFSNFVHSATTAVTLPVKNSYSSQQGGGRSRSRSRSRGQQHHKPNEYNDDKSVSFRVEVPAHVDYISSAGNPFVKHLVKLRQSSSYRHSVGSVVVVGTTLLREISESLQLKEAHGVLDYLLVKDGADMPLALLKMSRRIFHVNALVMQKLAGLESVEAIEAIGVIKLPKSFCNMESIGMQSIQTWFPEAHRLLVLDGIQDPGNLGTLLRTSVAFQWDGVFLLPGCCDPFNEKALRASQGACFQVPIATGLWSHIEFLRDRYQMDMYAAQQISDKTIAEIMARTHSSSKKDKTSIILSSSQKDSAVAGSRGSGGNFPAIVSAELVSSLAEKPVCLVLGSEGKGLSEKSKTSCNLIAIPMPGGCESLNVSVAGGILLFLLRRQT